MRFIALLLSIAVVGCAPAGARTEGTPSKVVEPADTILVNGKIVTVDDRFTIAQALGIKGTRIVAVGSNADIRERAAPGARVIDLQGRTVIPGLIDGHSHWIRAAEHDELRFDGVTKRKQEMALVAARVGGELDGVWIGRREQM